MKKFLLPAIVLLIFSISVSAQSFPKPVNYASDFANVIEPEWEAAINSLGREIELNSTSQVFIATVDDTTPYVAKEYATKLFDEWNIGQKGKDNGGFPRDKKKKKNDERQGFLPQKKQENK